MTITAVSALGTATSANDAANAASSTAASATSTLNLDFASYLKILTAQLKNQDPTNATDPNQFTQELVELGGVQQQITTNTNLAALIKADSANTLATGINYIGNYVEAADSTNVFPLQTSASEFGYTLASTASQAIVNISDSSGNVVAQLSGGTASGTNYVAWDGKDSSGNQLSDGTYTFSVAATDASGNTVTVSNPTAMFRVTSVQSNTDGSLQLLAGTLSLSSADVTNLYSSSTLPTTTYNSAYTSSSSTST
ncbi:MAG: FlgD immunoglobulin-like domain containing protein [Alphaproteobacteria bacterium]|nr:FlgD immunoglobulin-like domain containing protein [Alphaproteobacteria bacterium]